MWNRLVKTALLSVLLGTCSGCGMFCDRYCDRRDRDYYNDRRDRCDEPPPPAPRRNYANDCN